MSPPISGHVYDGSPEQTLSYMKDLDYQTDIRTLSSFWEGFHDPHSTIKTYYVSVGTCPDCEDVLTNQDIGITNSNYISSLSKYGLPLVRNILKYVQFCLLYWKKIFFLLSSALLTWSNNNCMYRRRLKVGTNLCLILFVSLITYNNYKLKLKCFIRRCLITYAFQILLSIFFFNPQTT